MTTMSPFAKTEVHSTAPTSLAQAAALLQQIEQGSITFELALNSAAITSLNIPDNSYLRVHCVFKNGQINASKTRVNFVDKRRQKSSLRWFFFRLNDFILQPHKNKPQQAHLVGMAKLWFIPLRKTVFKDLPLDINALLKRLSGIANIRSDSQAESSESEQSAKTSVFNATDYRYQADFRVAAGSHLELNEGTSIAVDKYGKAQIQIKGVKDYSVATITGIGVKLNTSILSTGTSDIDMRVTLNRQAQGRHHIAFADTVLRDVQFKSSDFDAPPIKALRIDAGLAEERYDFVITINPHDNFTLKTLIEKITQRIGDPQAVALLKQKLTAQVGSAQASAASEIVIDSARWNIVDYVTHDFKGQFSAVKDLPHIRQHWDDPAIEVLAKEAVYHLRRFIAAAHFQQASTYDPVKLAQWVLMALSVKGRAALGLTNTDTQASTKLLHLLGYSDKDSKTLSMLAEPSQASDELKTRLEKLGVAEHWKLAKKVEDIIRSIGHQVNVRERAWLREAWIDAGGMDSEGRAYALLARFSEALIDSVSEDKVAPWALKNILKTLPRGKALDKKIAVGSDNIRGAIWASQGVLKNGWSVVSEHLENKVEETYGNILRTGKQVLLPSEVFLVQSTLPQGQAFIEAQVRFIRDGEEFFQQIMKLLDDNERSFKDKTARNQATIALNYWAIEATEHPKNIWGLRIADRLKALAMQGFVVTIVVDEKNGPSRHGRIKLMEIEHEVKAKGLGRFDVHPWTPSADKFPLSTHVKYLLTPLGVIAGGSNLGDHYAHWSDTNMLLRGKRLIETFWQIHKDVLQEQKEVGQSVPELPALVPMPDAWMPLADYTYHGHTKKVYDPEWQAIRLRTFRDQGGDVNDQILVEMITALEAARGSQSGTANNMSLSRSADTIYMINAYFVLTQPIADHPMARAIRRAIERGVNIEIMTNSTDSSDEPLVAGPIIKSIFLVLAMARDIAKTNAKAGRLTVHLPDKAFIKKDENDVPEITIHDKSMFFGNMAFVTTHNLHPRSFTLEQELLTEMVSDSKPSKGNEHTEFMQMARQFLEHLKIQPGGQRIERVDELLAVVDWEGDKPPCLWGCAAKLYLLWLEKRYLYCHSFSSASDEEVKQVEAKLHESSKASVADLMINIF